MKAFQEYLKNHPIQGILIVLLLCHLAVLLIPLLWFVLISLLEGVDRSYELLQPADQIAQIRLVHVPEDIDLYQYPTDQITQMLDERHEVCVELEPADYEAFLRDFSDVPCHKWYNDPMGRIYEGTILIDYKDGSREWISWFGSFFHDSRKDSGRISWSYFDKDAFSDLLTAYRCHAYSDS